MRKNKNNILKILLDNAPGIVTILILCIIILIVFCSITPIMFSNKDMFDSNYTFNKAIMSIPNGDTIEIEIDQWTDYSDGEQIQITAKDGTIYLTSSYNCILIYEKE